MAISVRLKKAEVEVIQESLRARTLTKADAKVVAELLAKLERITEFGSGKKKATGLLIKDAIAAFRGVLGDRLVLPPRPDGAWWAIQTRGVQAAGFSEDDCRAIAKAASRWRSNFITLDTLIRQGVKLLAEADTAYPEGPSAISTSRPVEMDEL